MYQIIQEKVAGYGDFLVILALGRLRQAYQEFIVIIYIGSLTSDWAIRDYCFKDK